ncbi:hypothetical protein [Nocardioides caldifontis]|uniref:hypothetical protein n=1 Tax=Nocardioides caldifontis TaxID=2588938 RepID=UPI0011DF02D1|nr:hypothetical protein [Nocardioides caldifontis]
MTVLERGSTIVVRGWRVGDLLTEAGLRPVFNGIAGGFVLDADRLPDVVAALEYRNLPVAIVPQVPGGPGDAA